MSIEKVIGFTQGTNSIILWFELVTSEPEETNLMLVPIELLETRVIESVTASNKSAGGADWATYQINLFDGIDPAMAEDIVKTAIEQLYDKAVLFVETSFLGLTPWQERRTAPAARATQPNISQSWYQNALDIMTANEVPA